VKALLRRGLAFESLERYRSALEDIRAVLAINPTIEMANRAQVGVEKTRNG
jgi:singapore isolate B (sub-type 7) whole genome shotgun sequence assembly, scaffold_19